MASIFRSFQMSKLQAQTSSHGLDGEDPEYSSEQTTGNSVVAFMRSPVRLLSNTSRSASRHFTNRDRSGSSSGSHHLGGEERRAERKPTRRKTAAKIVKDGMGLIRDRLRHVTRSKDVAASHQDSRESELFKEEVGRSEKIQLVYGDLADIVRDTTDEAWSDRQVRPILNTFYETFICEAWHIAEKIFRSEQSKVEHRLDVAHEAERRSKRAHSEYMKDITALRDQIRALPQGATEAIRTTYFGPLDHLDQETKDLVLACSEERIKTLMTNMDKEENLFSTMMMMHVQEKAEELCDERLESTKQRMRGSFKREAEELISNERQRLEALFQDERQELQRRVDQLRQEVEDLKVQLQSCDDLHKSIAEQQLQHAVDGAAEAEELRQDLQQAQLENKLLTDRLDFTLQALSEAEHLLETQRLAKNEKCIPADRGSSKELPQATPHEFTTAQTSLVALPPSGQSKDETNIGKMVTEGSSRPILPGNTAAVLMDVHGSKDETNMGKMVTEGPSRPILPGSTATVLMEHAVSLHEGLDTEKGDILVSAKDLLSILDRFNEQLDTEVRRGALGALPEAFEGSLVITLLIAHINMVRSYTSALLPLAMLLLKFTGDLCSLANGKGTPQMKVTLMSRHLAEVRSEVRRLVSVCFSGAQHGFHGLEDLQLKLRSSEEGRGSERSDSTFLSTAEFRVVDPATVRTHTAPDILTLQDLPDETPKRRATVGNDLPDESPKRRASVPNIGTPRAKAKGGAKAKAKALGGFSIQSLGSSNRQHCDTTEPAMKQAVSLPASRGAAHHTNHHDGKRTLTTSSNTSTPSATSGGGLTPSTRRMSSEGSTNTPVLPDSALRTNVDKPQANTGQRRPSLGGHWRLNS